MPIHSLLLVVALATQQPDPPASATVVGRVVDASTGRAIAAVIVTPAGTAAPRPVGNQALAAPPRVMTNGSGQFAIRGLRKGSLVLTATKAGYAAATYGQRRPGGSTQPIPVTEGQRIDDVEIRMWKHASISGTVVDEAGEPVVGARLQAYQRQLSGGRRRYSPSRSGTTDDRGVYRIAGLTPGDYLVAMPQTQGAVPADVVDLLVNGGLNDPKRMEVQREGSMAGAMMAPMPGSTYSMKVGDQTISLPSGTVTPFAAPNNAILVYPTVFYPNGVLPSQAAPIALKSGDERGGIDLQVRPARGLRITGSVVGPDGPAPYVGMRLSAAGADDLIESLDAAATISDGTGSFTFPAVPPGQYLLRVTRVPRPPIAIDDVNRTTIVQAGGGVTISTSASASPPAGQPPPAAPIPADPTLCAQIPVVVGERDVSNLIVSLAPGPRVSGRVEFEGTAEKPPGGAVSGMRIVLEPADGSRLQDLSLSFQTGHPSEDGTFTTFGVPPGKYVVRVNQPYAGWFLKGAFYQGRDLSDTPVDLETKDISGVVLTFTDKPASITGTVRNNQTPDPDAVVLVYPIDSAAWSSTGAIPRRMRTARAAKDGVYTVNALPAGEYFVVAVKEDMIGDWQEPGLLQALSRLAQQVRIGDGEARQQDLTSATIR